MNPSVAVKLAWQVACAETVRSKKELIDPEQFLAALTSIKELYSDDLATAARAQGADPATLRAEMGLAADTLAAVGIDPSLVRRELRARVRVGTHQRGKDETIHRSDRSRQIFRRAEAAAREAKCTQVTVAYLFFAILEEKDSVGCTVVVEKGADLEILAGKTERSRASAGG